MNPEPITLVWSNLVTDSYAIKELLSVILEEIHRQQEGQSVADRGLERLDALVGIARSQVTFSANSATEPSTVTAEQWMRFSKKTQIRR